MRNEYLKEQIVHEKNEDEINQEIIKSLIEAKQELNNSHNNLKFADPELIDYYSYKIKADKSKIDYLIKRSRRHPCGHGRSHRRGTATIKSQGMPVIP